MGRCVVSIIPDDCGRCEFFRAEHALGDGAGVCRRWPPTLVPRSNELASVISAFPSVEFDDWCGEYKDSSRRVTPERCRDRIIGVCRKPFGHDGKCEDKR